MKKFYLILIGMLSAYLSVDAQHYNQIGMNTAQQSHFYGPVFQQVNEIVSPTAPPFSANYVYLFGSTELGLPNGAIITRLDWQAESGAPSINGGDILNLYMANTGDATIPITTGNNFSSHLASATAVRIDSDYSLPAGGGWIAHSLQPANYFTYTGGNLKVLARYFGLGQGTGLIRFQYENKPGLAAGVTATSYNPNLATVNFAANRSNNRPNIRIYYLFPGAEAGVQEILSPVYPVSAGASVPVSLRFFNGGNSAITSANIGYSLNNGTPVIESWTGNLTPDNFLQHSFTNPITMPASGGAFELKVWVTNLNGAGADIYPVNDTLVVNYCGTALAGGVYTVGGPSADFQSLNDVIDTLNCSGIAGSVQFSLANGTYTGNFTLSDVAGSQTNSISFLTASGNADSVIIHNGGAGPVFKVTQTPNVTLNGLTFVRTDSSPIPAPENNNIILKDADNFALTGCKLIGMPGTNGADNNLLFLSSDCDNVLISNNEFKLGNRGVEVFADPVGISAGIDIINNTFENTYSTPITLEKCNRVNIDNNMALATSGGNGGSGMRVNRSSNITLSNNRIYGTLRSDCFEIGDFSGSNNKVFNNVVSVHYASTLTPTAIRIESAAVSLLGGPGSLEVFNNSFNIISSVRDSSSNEDALITISDFTSGTPAFSAFSFVNNVFRVNSAANFPPGFELRNFCINRHSNSNNYIPGILTSDYNDFYNPMAIKFARVGTGDIDSLVQWRTQTGQDANSFIADPLFFRDDIIIPLPGSPILAAGIPVAGITTDVNGNSRSATAPSIGAYERAINIPQQDIYAYEVISPTVAAAIPGSVHGVAYRFINYGYDTLRTANMHYQFANGPIITEVFNGNLAFGDTADFYFSSSLTLPMTGTPLLSIWSSLPNGQTDSLSSNDSLTFTFCLPIPAGTYTMGGPTSDYPDLPELFKILACAGISGPVTFSADFPGNTLNRTIDIYAIPGASAVNTVVFDGQGDTLTYAASGLFAITRMVLFDGARHVTLKNFYIKPLNSTYLRGIQLRNGADSNVIEHNIIDLSSAIGRSDNIGIVTSASTDQSSRYSANEANYNLIHSNLIRGGYTGIQLTSTSDNNIISNNEITDFDEYGIYMDSALNNLVENNDVHRTDWAEDESFGFIGIYLTGNTSGTIVRNNRFHDSHTSAGDNDTSHAIGIDLTNNNPGSILEPGRNYVYNNLIYNLNNSKEHTVGVYTRAAHRAEIINNTIVLDHIAARSGPAEGIRLDGIVTDMVIKNNNVVVKKGGSGWKLGMLIKDTLSNTTFTSDNNNFYVDAPGSIQQGPVGLADTLGFFGIINSVTAFPTLADWQNQTRIAGSYDSLSVSVDPLFRVPAYPDYVPNHSALNGSALPVSYVTTDFSGALRDAQFPDMGAHEFCPSTTDSVSMGICQGTSLVFGGQTLTTAGVYSGLFQNATGCDSTVILTLQVSNVITTNITAAICQGDSYTFDSQTLTTAGTYTNTYQTGTGCDSTVSLQLSVNPVHSAATTATICQGAVYDFGGQSLTTSGTYNNTFQNSFGCDSVIALTLTVTPVDTAVNVNGLTLTANASNATYQWLNCNSLSPLAGATNRDYTVSLNGNYAVIVTQNGCVDTSNCYQFTNVGVDEIVGMSDIKLYPNPSTGVVHIAFELAAADPIHLQVLDARGRKVYVQQLEVNAGANLFALNLDLAEGMYAVIIKSQKGEQTVRRFLISR